MAVAGKYDVPEVTSAETIWKVDLKTALKQYIHKDIRKTALTVAIFQVLFLMFNSFFFINVKKLAHWLKKRFKTSESMILLAGCQLVPLVVRCLYCSNSIKHLRCHKNSNIVPKKPKDKLAKCWMYCNYSGMASKFRGNGARIVASSCILGGFTRYGTMRRWNGLCVFRVKLNLSDLRVFKRLSRKLKQWSLDAGGLLLIHKGIQRRGIILIWSGTSGQSVCLHPTVVC